MKRIVYCGILVSLLTWNSSAEEETPESQTTPQEETVIIRRQTTEAEKEQFASDKEECVRLLRVVSNTRNNPTTLDLMKLRNMMSKISPPEDIVKAANELQKIADAVRLYGRSVPGPSGLISVPKDCMGFPRCSDCVGGRKLSVGSRRSIGTYVKCNARNCEGGVLKEKNYRGEYINLVFDRALAKEAFQMRLEKISAWLTLAEPPLYVSETKKVPVTSTTKSD